MRNGRSASVAVMVTLAVTCGLGVGPMLWAQPQLTEAQMAALQPISPLLLPRVGTYWSLAFPTNPPLPKPVATNLPVYRLPDGTYLVDDSSLPVPPKGGSAGVAAAARSMLIQGGLTTEQRLLSTLLNEQSAPGLPGDTNAPPDTNASPPQLLAPEAVPTNGTFRFLVESNWPPTPLNLCTGCDVYLLSDGTYLVDDSTYTWPEPTGGSGGYTGPFEPQYATGDLWLEITGVSNSLASLILHGSEPGTNYTILTRQRFAPDDPWDAELQLVGAAGGQETPFQVPLFGRPRLFFRAYVGLDTPKRLWLYPLGVTSNQFDVVVHGTVEGIRYDIRSTTALGGLNDWAIETNFPGATGQFWTAVSIPLSARPNLFLSVRSWVDSDGDGMADWWEMANGLNRLDPSDAGLDPDDDGQTNYQESQGGGNPFDNMLVVWGDNLNKQGNVPWGFDPVAGTAGGGGAGAGGHTLVLTLQGTVVAWGATNLGQINVPAGLSNVVAVAAGGDQSVALKTDGSVV